MAFRSFSSGYRQDECLYGNSDLILVGILGMPIYLDWTNSWMFVAILNK
jgi:hypothetical protein